MRGDDAESEGGLGGANVSRTGAEPLDVGMLIRQHHASVYRYAFRLTGQAADAEELTQLTFVSAHQHLPQLRNPAQAQGWLWTILRNHFLKVRRKRMERPATALELDIDQVPDVVPTADEIDQGALQAALDNLPNDQRVVVLMYYFEDRSYKEIASLLEIPIGTVMSRLARAKGRLRHELVGSLDEPAEEPRQRSAPPSSSSAPAPADATPPTPTPLAARYTPYEP